MSLKMYKKDKEYDDFNYDDFESKKNIKKKMPYKIVQPINMQHKNAITLNPIYKKTEYNKEYKKILETGIIHQQLYISQRPYFNYNYEENKIPFMTGLFVKNKNICLHCFEEFMFYNDCFDDMYAEHKYTKCEYDNIDNIEVEYEHIILFIQGNSIITNAENTVCTMRIMKGECKYIDLIENIDNQKNIVMEFSFYDQMDTFDETYIKIIKEYKERFFDAIFTTTCEDKKYYMYYDKHLYHVKESNSFVFIPIFEILEHHETTGYYKNDLKKLINKILETNIIYEPKNIINYGKKNKSIN
jgi:hypothetical protein